MFVATPALGGTEARAADPQSPKLPSIAIGYARVWSEVGPRSGSRRRTTLSRGITYSFHRFTDVSRRNRAEPRPFVKPFPFVRPFVIPRRIEASPFTSPFVSPLARPRNPFVMPFVRPFRPFVSPFVRPRNPFVSPFVRPRSPFVRPFVRPFRPFVRPFVLPVGPRPASRASPFVIPRRPVSGAGAGGRDGTTRSAGLRSSGAPVSGWTRISSRTLSWIAAFPRESSSSARPTSSMKRAPQFGHSCASTGTGPSHSGQGTVSPVRGPLHRGGRPRG